MKPRINVLKDPRAGFKQVRYIAHYLWIGRNTDIRNFVDRLDILSTYLPLFLPMKGEVLKELSDPQKATILYDTLPHYNIEKMKEANKEPIEMSLEDLFQFAMNIEESVINPGKDAEGNPRYSKETNSLEAGGWETLEIIRKVEPNLLLKGQDLPSCDFCGRKGHTDTACRIKQKAMASAKKDTKDSSAQ
jgi:hypothetical protein